MHRRQFLKAMAVTGSGLAFLSPLFRLNPALAARVARVSDIMAQPGYHQPNLSAARRVVLDPGHGGWDSGGVGVDGNGNTVYEKDFTLSIALRAAALLHDAGCAVALTRTSDTALSNDGVYPDLQARIDVANAFGADAFLSIHVNAYPGDPSLSGIQTYYCDARPFGGTNQVFASSIQEYVMGAMNQIGLQPVDRGAAPDTELSGTGYLVVLGPPDDNHPRATQMPGALTELMYITDPVEVDALEDESVQNALAGGIARGIQAQLQLL